MDISQQNSFIIKLEGLTSEERANIVVQGIDLLRRFDIEPEFLTEKINPDEYPRQYYGVLQLYFFYYLWILHEIDNAYVTEASQIPAGDSESFEKVKKYYMGLIETSPIDMVDFVLSSSQARLNTKSYTPEEIIRINELFKKGELKASAQLDGVQLDKNLLIKGLSALIDSVKEHLETDLDGKVHEALKTQSDEMQQRIQSEIDDENLKKISSEISSKINEIFNNWTSAKEQMLDSQAQYLMKTLTDNTSSISDPGSPLVEEEFTLEDHRSFLPAYQAYRMKMLPIILVKSLHEMMMGLGSQASDQDSNNQLSQLQNISKLIPNLSDDLKKIMKTIEDADRLFFAFQQIASTPVIEVTLKKSAGR